MQINHFPPSFKILFESNSILHHTLFVHYYWACRSVDSFVKIHGSCVIIHGSLRLNLQLFSEFALYIQGWLCQLLWKRSVIERAKEGESEWAQERTQVRGREGGKERWTRAGEGKEREREREQESESNWENKTENERRREKDNCREKENERKSESESESERKRDWATWVDRERGEHRMKHREVV